MPAKEIGLQLEPDGELVVFGFTHAAPRGLHAITDSEQLLQMVSDLVRDDVGLREIAGCAEAFMEHPEKTEVDVNASIFRAIEWTAGAAGETHSPSGSGW